ncbi:MAG: UDP-N-acetylglucosamine--N-acetylmuramyl-(pentapeptide) pyrophosphoryl-undecaprenol N-acetylglucosamine transferase [Alphaproteobacteria bacterium]|nr:UDP-N-acetylglucosamine--N-acetylmuramyl-(pentapeptide) pyrophosphoryl-undecaprenol N-acetylglucosamine transferase [Alphaproteobacteria bacterium]
MKNIWIATGGTGGHVFPAVAVAAELSRHGHRVTISTDGRVMDMVRKNKPPRAGIVYIWAGGVGGKSKFRAIISLFKIAITAALLTLRFMIFRPDKVVSFGGYASVPAILAARVWRVPVYLHEQNAVIGRANKFALRWIDVLMTSFPKVNDISKTNAKIIYTGLPVRNEFHPKPISSDQPRILITGGSLGASVLDDIVPKSIVALPVALKKKLFIVHQTRPDAVRRLQKFYADAGIHANVLSFIHDMAEQMAKAQLVIGRSGASTVVELQTLGRPAILVPLNINPDQAANANAFASSGGGFAIPQEKFTVKWLSATVADLFGNPARLNKMADKAKVPNKAVENIVKLLMADQLIKGAK